VRRGGSLLLAAVLAAALFPAVARAYDPALEATNFAKIEERNLNEVFTPEFQTRLNQQNTEEAAGYPQTFVDDPERNPHANTCARRSRECAGDVRFYDWDKDNCTPSGPCGIRTPVLFTSRSGATLSGSLWATAAGPAQRPAVVIVNGSVGAPEVLYWGFAATLAKRGYVVLTYDPQGQGRSDTFGEDPDENESVPAQNGEPFFDGPEDALNFLLSTPGSPYVPLPSCTSGTSHAPKQDRRVAEGRNAPFNPMHSLIDATRIGLAGHSFGASGVSYVGQKDPRVDAIVGWDNLAASSTGGGTATTTQTCPMGTTPRDPAPLTKPALGMSADYFLTPQPYTSDPALEQKNNAFNVYKTTGVDSMQVNIRGGTHYEFSFLPGTTLNYPFGKATWRGMHMVNWYTAAWFDKYVKGGDATADARLLTNRWQDDAMGESVDMNTPKDGNLYSFYFDSAYDFHKEGGMDVVCGTDPATLDGMRPGCPDMAADGLPPDYSYIAEANTADGPPTQAPPDTDGDGVPDPEDSCPTVGGPASNGGCPVQPRQSTPAATAGACLDANTQNGTRRGDRLVGSALGDRLVGFGGRDRLFGEGGDDCLFGRRGRDRLFGGPGQDVIRGGNANDRIFAGDGEADVVLCGRGRDRVVTADAVDTLSRCEVVP
jgi:dienelactone hydrolase